MATLVIARTLRRSTPAPTACATLKATSPRPSPPKGGEEDFATAVRAADGTSASDDILAFFLKLNLEVAEKEYRSESIPDRHAH
jgi:hypothetical protein